MARRHIDDDVHTSHSIAPDLPSASRGEHAYLLVLAGVSFGEMFKVKSTRTVIGRGENADIRISDDGVSRQHAAIEVNGDEMALVDLGSTNGTFVNGARVARRMLSDGDKISVGSTTILKFTYQDQLDEGFQRKMYESALRDGLTNAYNKRYFQDRLSAELRYALRHSSQLALLFVDLDHFKAVNDEHGHQAGDFILSEISKVIGGSLRAEDVFARYGGEEFAVILRGIDLVGAEVVAVRLRKLIAERRFEWNGKTIAVTASIGVASSSGVSDIAAFVASADAAMYEAKRTGRNRVCLHKPG